MEERYELTVERIRQILEEETVKEPYRDYFRTVASFLLSINERKKKLEEQRKETQEELKEEMERLYRDILPEHYASSYADPEWAVAQLGLERGQLLSALYAELRGQIAYVWEERLDYLTVGNELFIQIYNKFEEEDDPDPEALREIFYWYASDYCDVFAADRISEQIDPEAGSFLVRRIMESDLDDLSYLYRTGEYVGTNERETAEYLRSLSQETIDRMADTFTEGFRMGFVVSGRNLGKKSVVNIHYTLGFERVIRKAVENFAAMGLQTTISRTAMSVVTRQRVGKKGFFGGAANRQYEYDHKDDLALVLDKQFMERKLEVMQTVYSQNKELAAQFAGPAVMEVFGEEPFAPRTKDAALRLSKKQEKILLSMNVRAGQITNTYLPAEERSFTIISWPVPEIGPRFEEIFAETIRINTLDSVLYGKVQQTIIDVLDQGAYVRVKGKGANKTDLKIRLWTLTDPQKETIFENCVADMNIPVGEVFTSPVLKGTDGVLFVSKVYLYGLQYENLELHFRDGMIESYTCTNFSDEEECRRYVADNILRNHPTLPMGEFAIGTNTTAYAAARRYQIAEKLPILIAEKMGPHFAVGDTCYSWAEDTPVYNPDGKEIVARENEVSALRTEDPEKAYFQCHTDITIPYEELGKISVVGADDTETDIIRDGRFVLPGTEILNEPLDTL